MVDVKVPQDLWEEDREGVVVSWVYQDGALVEEGKLICELMVEKVQLELVSPSSGRLRILAAPETVIRKGDVIARIEPA